MHKRHIEHFMIDILITIDKIKRNIREFKTVEEFASNEQAFDAIMRELEVIGEAVKYIIQNREIPPQMGTELRKVVDFRNIIAHEYFGIDAEIIWDIIKNKLPELKKTLQSFNL